MSYKRILLKFSGESLADSKNHEIFSKKTINEIADVIVSLVKEGVEIGVVVGAGNICRGSVNSQIGFDREDSDYMGMLGTVINAISISSVLKQKGVKTQVFSALGNVVDQVKAYDIRTAKAEIATGKVCFFAAGVGKPYYTTDTAATLRAIETECDAIFMGKNGVKGVYDKDPKKFDNAKFIDHITYQEMLDKNIMVMDRTAIDLIKTSNIKIHVFNANDVNNYLKVVHGECIGTICDKGE